MRLALCRFSVSLINCDGSAVLPSQRSLPRLLDVGEGALRFIVNAIGARRRRGIAFDLFPVANVTSLGLQQSESAK